MLMGTFEHRLDTKARLVLPAKFRERLGDTLVAAIGMEHCVSLYSLEEWENFTAWLKTSSFLDSERTGFCCPGCSATMRRSTRMSS